MHKIFLTVFLLSTFIWGIQDDKKLLEKLRHDLKEGAPFKAEFLQKVMDEEEVLDEAKGELLYVNPYTFKLTYRDPEFKIALFKEDSYLFYDEENEQVTKSSNVKSRKDFLWRFIFDESMRKYITVDTRRKVVKISKKDENLHIEVFIQKNGMPGKVVHKTGGNTNIYIFRNYRKRVKVSDKDFEFIYPEGVEVLEM